MYLFDTDIVSNVLKKRPSPQLIRRLETVSPDKQFISIITVSEIVYGAWKSQIPGYHLNLLETVLLPEMTIIGFGMEAAYIAGMIRAELEKTGMRLSWTDIQIASIAMADHLTLITGNIRHFQRIPGLIIENWLVN